MGLAGAVFVHDCGRCGATSVAFTITSEAVTDGERDADGDIFHDAIAVCGHCRRGSVATFYADNDPLRDLRFATLTKLLPERPSVAAPRHTPANVAHFYKQGKRNLLDSFDAAGAMFRKTLDTGLKEKFPNLKGRLAARIKAAGKQGLLTQELADWANKIRLDGNDAAHDQDPFTKEEAETLATFTELILLYLFTLPGMLLQAQGREEDAPTE